MFETPILFLIFNRPDTTLKVFERIREVKPKYLFVAADGPRPKIESDIINCKAARDIIDSIDWDCELTTLYRVNNLGCKRAVSDAINWFFDHVEDGIILEDDILPDLSFFEFCNELLKKYRDNEKIMHITGFNVCETWNESKQDYHYSFFGSIWGWATWRRAWQYYDVNIEMWNNKANQQKVLSTYFPYYMREQRKNLYDELYNGKINTWDYQWTLSRLLNNGLSIIPSKNLINNIGFNNSSTHSHVVPAWIPKNTYSIKLPLHFNNKIVVDHQYDRKHNKFAYGKPVKFIYRLLDMISTR